MSSSFDEAVQRTSLSMSNQMEMLIFRLTDNQFYGINVFKIIEILECPKKIDRVPHSHPAVRGVIDFRGKAIAAIDLSQAIGLSGKNFNDELAYLIICEYNQLLTAFIIESPESLMTRSWSDIHKPKGINAKSLVAIAYNDENEAVMLLDIETVLAEVVGLDGGIDVSSLGRDNRDWSSLHILLVDDSRTALLLLQSLLDKLGCRHTSMQTAAQALEFLNNSGLENSPLVDMVISDIEMPGMDGFTLTRTIRENPACRDLKIMLHSSMSNPTNQIKAKQSGANDFVAKFDPIFLSNRIAALCGLTV
ncbi:MAG: chemotaxis protein CheV [Chlorobium sp.]|jgi:two-component system chemotaxis response regulator CheV|nr:chemotaxis protein CheV [Chlorobium sp.]